MPINELLAQHRLAQLNANTAASEEERAAFVDLESYYAAKIEAWRTALERPSEHPASAPQANPGP